MVQTMGTERNINPKPQRGDAPDQGKGSGVVIRVGNFWVGGLGAVWLIPGRVRRRWIASITRGESDVEYYDVHGR